MFNHLIRFSLNNRLLVLSLAAILMVLGAYQSTQLQVDVLPDLTRPRVVVMVESPGMAPEEVEMLVTTPIETYLNGATGLTALRSTSTAGLAVLTIEFDWNMDLARCRIIVDERLQLVKDRLPPGVVPRMGPVSSMMGQLMHLTVWDEHDELSPMELRTLADWTVRRRIMSVSGVSEVLVLGGDVRQIQVQARIDDMFRHGVTFDDIQTALEGSNRNVTGGFLTNQGPQEFLVRSIGRLESHEELKSLVVKGTSDPPIQLHQVADVAIAPAPKVGSSGVYLKNSDGTMIHRSAIVLNVEKQPGKDTRELTDNILNIADEIQQTINATHPGIRIAPLYQQKTFIDLAIKNVEEAIVIGAILLVCVLFFFLMDLRITLIAMLAIPASLATSCLVFAWFGFSINTMTLGGLAIAVGELVDDAIVYVENIYRRLRENFRKPPEERLSNILIVYRAGNEIRNAIVNATFIVTIVFCPVFFLEGMEGRMFTPMGVAYIVALLASLLTSMTVTPVLAYLLLIKKAEQHKDKESFVLKSAKWGAERIIRFSLTFPKTILACSVLAVLVAAVVFFTRDRDFMPPFNEGVPQVNVILPPGTSLQTSTEFSSSIAQELLKIDGVVATLRETGRAELDEHAVPVSGSEIKCIIDFSAGRGIMDVFADIEKVIDPENAPGAITFYDQPLQHLIGYLQTGSSAKIAIKVRGDNPLLLRQRAIKIQRLISGIPDVGNPRISPIQIDVPQIRFILKRDELARYGLIPEEVNANIETAMRGVVATEILEDKRTIDVLLRVSDRYRENLEAFAQIPIQTPGGQLIPLSAVADIDAHATGPSRIDHEAGQPQITIQMSPNLRSSIDVKEDIDRVLAPHMAELTSNNVFLEMTGLFQSERAASQRLAVLSIISLSCIFLILYRMFHSVRMSLQVMATLPLALVGAVIAIVVTGQDRSVPNLIGMISLCGIASRNGILIIDHYFHLVRNEGHGFTKEMIIKAGCNRAAPVLMTMMATMCGLISITLSPDTPGREILYPIATVIVGGLLTSTLMEFLVRPALFWTVGRKVAERIIERDREEKGMVAVN